MDSEILKKNELIKIIYRNKSTELWLPAFS